MMVCLGLHNFGNGSYESYERYESYEASLKSTQTR